MDRIFSFLERMRARPEHARRTFAFGVAGGFTTLLLIVWGFFLLPNSIGTIRENAPVVPAPNTTNTPGASASPKEDWQTVWARMQAEYGVDAPTNGGNNTTVPPSPIDATSGTETTTP